MAIEKLHTWVAVVGIVVLAGAAWWWQQRPQAVVEGASAGAVAPSPAASGTGAGTGGAAGAGPVPVEVGKVEATRLEEDAQAVGSVRAAQTVMLRPEVSGRVVRIGFTDGQRVRRGQLLVQLDDSLQRAQLQQAQAQASIARTNLQRSRELQAQNFVSQSAVDQNAAALQVTEAQVALAQAQLDKLRVLSPFDGAAGIRSVNLGDYVKDGAELVNVEDRSHMWVDFRLAERYIGSVKAGQAVEVQLDAMPGQQLRATVAALDTQIDANGRSLLVRSRLESPGTELKTGMFARARIVFAVRDKALLVPEEALVPQGGKQYIVKVIEGDNGAKLSKRIEARIGARVPGKVEILDGLAAGDSVVTAGQARAMRADGLALRVIDLDKPGAGPRAPGAASRAASGGASGAVNGNGAASSPAARQVSPA